MTQAPTPLARRSRADVRIKVSLQYPDQDAFVERFSHNVSRTGMFIRASDPPAVGSRVHFEYRLANGSRIMRGVGLVRWTRPRDQASPGEPPGMGIEFVDLDPQTETLIDHIVATYGDGKRAPQRARPKVAPKPTLGTGAPPLTLADAHLDPEEEDALEVLVGAKPVRALERPPEPQAPAPEASLALDDVGGAAPIAEDEPVDLEEPRAPSVDIDIDLDDEEEAPAQMEPEPQPTPAETVAPAGEAEATPEPWLLDLCGADLLLAHARGGKLVERQTRPARLKAGRGRVESAEDGVWVPHLVGWLSAPWPSAYAVAAARRLGLSLTGGADGRAALRLGALTVSLADALTACLQGLPISGGGAATVIVPSGLTATAQDTLREALAAVGLSSATLVPDAVALLARLKKALAAGALAVVVDVGLFEARVTLVAAPADVQAARATLGSGLWDADELLIDRADTAYLRQHALDLAADEGLRDALARQIGALRRAGTRTAWKLSVGEKDLELPVAQVARFCEPLSERLALAVDAVLVAAGRHAGELAALVLASEEPLWPGAAQAMATLLGTAPLIVPPTSEVRLAGAVLPTWPA